ncbi:hypothetical protein ACFW2V_13765 [Streptomyces sp. NPDC058947]|uniref:hypothetical protein n=1 Tax=Streptomyces sp. NPDC058947 TaxID=3346675 RepID=UPI0036B37E56
MSEKPGMQTVREWLSASSTASPEEICHRMASEIRGEINGLWASMNGPVSARPGRTEVARREARIDGMKWMLALALGIPLGGWQEAVDAFLEEFKNERLAARKGL